MFEKEAEEYAIENWEHYEEGQNDSKALKQAYQQGAEFGYNKVNEWHFVKDGNYPKKTGVYLVAWKRTHHVEEYGEWGFDVDLFNADEGYFEGVGDYVIAWCEVPKFEE